MPKTRCQQITSGERRANGTDRRFLLYFRARSSYLVRNFDPISGHLLGDLITWLGLGNGWFIVMLLSNVLSSLGIWIITAGWERVYRSEGELVTHGIYAHVRHPQYTGIFIITLGFMIQWPTITTLILWPFVLVMYVQLARREEQDILAKYPQTYRTYRERTPMFFSRRAGKSPHSGASEISQTDGRGGE